MPVASCKYLFDQIEYNCFVRYLLLFFMCNIFSYNLLLAYGIEKPYKKSYKTFVSAPVITTNTKSFQLPHTHTHSHKFTHTHTHTQMPTTTERKQQLLQNTQIQSKHNVKNIRTTLSHIYVRAVLPC